mgnify:FL=1
MTELNDYLAAWEPVSPSLQGVAVALSIDLDDPVEQAGLRAHRRVRELENMVAKVRALHKPMLRNFHAANVEVCSVCGLPYPCNTIRILNGDAL